MRPTNPQDLDRREWLGVAVLTVIGFGLRLWPIGRLGLNHFDEGIYAFASTWSLRPGGLLSMDPSLIPYAPPGFPILCGLACWLLGSSDGALIAVSQLAGTLTVPIVAWLARRTFGPGAGFAAGAFCAMSGPHIAFSRMALTDASFLLAWLVALGLGMRFLERPGLIRAILMGLAVGLAQQFKYNGWLTGGIVIGSVVLGLIVRPEGRNLGSILKTFGWGGLAAGLSSVVVWPWYSFVESHGGYSALLRHQRSYLGGFDRWWPNLLTQADQAVALSGGLGLTLPALVLAGLTPWINPSASGLVIRRSVTTGPRWLGPISAPVLAWFFADSPLFLGIPACGWLIGGPSPSARMVGVWWLAMAAIAPFYHPYARLWLPLHAANWLLMGWWVSDGLLCVSRLDLWKWNRSLLIATFIGTTLLAVIGGGLWLDTHSVRRARPQPSLLAPSDSLYRAVVEVSRRLPEHVKGLRVLARPPVSYYLAGRVAITTMAGSDDLSKPSDLSVWALVDSAILRSEAGRTSEVSGRELLDRFDNRWEMVEEFPSTLSLPALLDLDPGAAVRSDADRSCPLWLLRPRTSKATR